MNPKEPKIKPWTEEEMKYLRTWYGYIFPKRMAEHLGRTLSAVENRLKIIRDERHPLRAKWRKDKLDKAKKKEEEIHTDATISVYKGDRMMARFLINGDIVKAEEKYKKLYPSCLGYKLIICK